MKSFIVATFLFAASALAQTPPITVTQPLTAFNWTTCTPQVIAWVQPTAATISEIWLATGATTALQKVLLVASNVPTSPGTYTWTPPSSITTGQYSLEFGTAPNLAYAGPFTITQSGNCSASGSGPAGSGAPATDSSAPSSAAASSAPAASSAASSAAPAGGASPTSAAAGGSSSAAASSPAPTTSKTSGAASNSAYAVLALIPLIAVALY